MGNDRMDNAVAMRKESRTLLLFLVLTSVCLRGVFAAGEKLDPPKGFATYAEVQKAVTTGKVPLISAPKEVPDGIEEMKDIEYGKVGDRSLQLDLYRPKDLKRAVPVIIFIHGGGWYKGNRQDYRLYVIDFAKRGYVTATISYRFTDVAKYPAQIEDAKCAVRFLRANAAKYSIDPNKIAVAGGSAGGHLSLMVGYTPEIKKLEGEGGNPGVSSAVQAVIDLYGPTDLTTKEALVADPIKRFFPRPYEESKEDYEMASPMTHVHKGNPPTLIFQGTVDETVPVSQSDRLAEALKKAGVPVQYERLEGWPHTMDIAKSVNAYCQQQMAGFLKKYLPIEP